MSGKPEPHRIDIMALSEEALEWERAELWRAKANVFASALRQARNDIIAIMNGEDPTAAVESIDAAFAAAGGAEGDNKKNYTYCTESEDCDSLWHYWRCPKESRHS